MSKKRFTEGLESLFSSSSGKHAAKGGDHSFADTIEATSSRKDAAAKKQNNKDFSSDLASLLTAAFEESFEEQLSAGGNPATDQRQKARPASGLDLLIRTNITPKSIDIQTFPTRRITLSFDTEMLEKLKSIAQQEHTILKDIVNDIVAEYISSYEKKKGKLT